MFGLRDAGRGGGGVQRWAVSVRTLGSMLFLPFVFKAKYMPTKLIPNELFQLIMVVVRNVHHFPKGYHM